MPWRHPCRPCALIKDRGVLRLSVDAVAADLHEAGVVLHVLIELLLVGRRAHPVAGRPCWSSSARPPSASARSPAPSSGPSALTATETVRPAKLRSDAASATAFRSCSTE